MDREPKPIATHPTENSITVHQDNNHQEQGCDGFSQEELENLFDGWLEQEKNGVQFPVDFDTAWQIAGYYRKDYAKQKLTSSKSQLTEGIDFTSETGNNFYCDSSKNSNSAHRGRPSDSISLTCDAFKHFCLMAETEEGRKIRQYFIEAEKNWKLVQKKYPDVAQDVELEKLRLQSEIAKNQCEATKAQERIMKTSESIMTIHGSKMLALMMGNPNAVVEKVEYRDRGSN